MKNSFSVNDISGPVPVVQHFQRCVGKEKRRTLIISPWYNLKMHVKNCRSVNDF